MGLILALLAVSFLPTYAPPAYAGNPTGSRGDNPTEPPTPGGPDDPSDAPGSKGSASIGTPQVAVGSGDYVGEDIYIRKNGAHGVVIVSGGAAFWLSIARTTLLGYWLHR